MGVLSNWLARLTVNQVPRTWWFESTRAHMKFYDRKDCNWQHVIETNDDDGQEYCIMKCLACGDVNFCEHDGTLAQTAERLVEAQDAQVQVL